MLKLAAAAALALAVPAAVAAQAEQPAFPAWLAGAWSLSGEGDAWTEEFWTHPRAGMMIGASREGRGETLRSWESIRILRTDDGSLAYVPMPNGGTPVEFALSGQGTRMIEFANPGHDYPQRIRYWRDGKDLIAEVSLGDGSKPQRWRYSPRN